MSKATFDRDGDVGILTLRHPPLNLFVPELVDDLERLAGEVEGLPLRALVIRADGDNFSAGADVGAMFRGRSAEEARRMIGRFVRLLARFERLPYPTLAAVQGLCLAAGFELVLACDLAWAGESAQLGLVEAVIGTTPLGGGSQRLAERAGAARAREMVMTAGTYDAATCERWNVVNRVVPDGELAAKSLKFAHHLASGPTRAHAATKRILREALDRGTAAADAILADAAAPLFDSEDMRQGIDSLLKQGPGKARFRGR